MKTAVITGSAGQDGTYLSAHLSSLGYRVIGLTRTGVADIADAGHVTRLLEELQPAEVYHLAAYHHSSQDTLSDDLAVFRHSNAVHCIATANLLEAIRKATPATRFFFAASCHLFGAPTTALQDEATPFNPDGLYGITKLMGVQLCHYYRHKYQMFAAVGILYNHESPLRAPNFVSQKIVKAAVAIRAGRQTGLTLGDLDATVDWGFAGDYVDAMHRTLQLPSAEDFVIASGTPHRVGEFVEEAFQVVGLDWRKYVVIDPALLRQSQRLPLVGNSSKLSRMTDWEPHTNLKELVRIMIAAEQRR
ncbi:MAG: GDP-mannose 4,6-dehydratase [Verrucomicrobiota bacterium]|jgi:GDPmannose 4,6-dehydratase